MYTFSKKLKTTALILIILGLVGIVYGFLSTPKTIEEVEKIVAESHHEGHNTEAKEIAHAVAKPSEETKAEIVVKDSTATAIDTLKEASPAVSKLTSTKEEKVDEAKEHKEHLQHVFHQLQNKPWSALYVACIFFMLISLGALAFYAIQQVAQAGWSPVLF
ncbi:MAG: quinol:cytochrome C oxidoreductase, partial [Flavobacterium sp.]